MNLDIDALRTFVAIAETKSFTSAAAMVSRTQSTVSMQIKKLEDRLGFVLLERSRRALTISPGAWNCWAMRGIFSSSTMMVCAR